MGSNSPLVERSRKGSTGVHGSGRVGSVRIGLNRIDGSLMTIVPYVKHGLYLIGKKAGYQQKEAVATAPGGRLFVAAEGEEVDRAPRMGRGVTNMKNQIFESSFSIPACSLLLRWRGGEARAGNFGSCVVLFLFTNPIGVLATKRKLSKTSPLEQMLLMAGALTIVA